MDLGCYGGRYGRTGMNFALDSSMKLAAIDIETTGLTPVKDKIVSVQFAIEGDTFVCDDPYEAWETLLDLHYSGFVIVGHNISFDLAHLYSLSGRFVKFRVLDTMWLFRFAFPKMYEREGLDPKVFEESISLASLVKRFLGIELDKSVRESFEGGVLLDYQSRYGAFDAATTLRLAERFIQYLPEHTPLVEWLSSASLLVALASATGMRIYREGLFEAIREVEAKLDETRAALADFGLEGKAVNSPKKILEALRELGAGVGGTDEYQLKLVSEGEGAAAELAQLVLDYRGYMKELQFLQDLDTDTLRPLFSIARAASFRMSSSNPNAQQIPKSIRKYIKPLRGKFFVADYSQQELRIAAARWGVKGMLEALANGKDIHTETAKAMFADEWERLNEEERASRRKVAKSINFGALYGIGAAKLAKYVKANAGLELSEVEAAEYLARWKQTYPEIQEIHTTAFDLFANTDLELVHIGYEAYRPVWRATEWLNTQIQSTGALILYELCSRLLTYLPDDSPIDQLPLIPSAFVHDEVVITIPEGNEGLTDVILGEMRVAGNRVIAATTGLALPIIEVDGTIKDSWA